MRNTLQLLRLTTMTFKALKKCKCSNRQSKSIEEPLNCVEAPSSLSFYPPKQSYVVTKRRTGAAQTYVIFPLFSPGWHSVYLVNTSDLFLHSHSLNWCKTVCTLHWVPMPKICCVKKQFFLVKRSSIQLNFVRPVPHPKLSLCCSVILCMETVPFLWASFLPFSILPQFNKYNQVFWRHGQEPYTILRVGQYWTLSWCFHGNTIINLWSHSQVLMANSWHITFYMKFCEVFWHVHHFTFI